MSKTNSAYSLNTPIYDKIKNDINFDDSTRRWACHLVGVLNEEKLNSLLICLSKHVKVEKVQTQKVKKE